MQFIEVNVKSEFIEQQSSPEKEDYVFSYTVTIANQGPKKAKLLSRHWIITDGEGQTYEVKGDGVVGKQPALNPGECFEYTSGARLKTPIGFMHGSYQMIDQDGEMFDANIEPFRLYDPKMVN